jgi:hypothetical protein
MAKTEQNYPLAWPDGWKRTSWASRGHASFMRERQRLAITDGLGRLHAELRRLLGKSELERAVISSNLRVRLDGWPLANQAEPSDPGVAVYFTFANHRTALASDKWNRVADNLAALAAHIECIRGIERYGVGTMEQAFRGYQALENFSGGAIPWRRVLGFKDGEAVTLAQAESKYRELMKLYHTDVAGGDHTQAAQLNVAIEQARKELGGAH